jgi:transcriptional regulator with XRE-family HTH domain
MTSRELFRLLMAREGLNPYSLSKRLNGRTKQPQLHRYLKGSAAEPRRATLAPVAEFFKIPLEALFDDDAATEAARSLGLMGEPAAEPPPARQPTTRAPLDQALDVVLDAIASAPDKARLRTALMALLDDDAPAYRQRVAELLAPPLAEPGKRKA